jgi:glycosyltransferase involved in cell wall biosynthesis
MSKDDYDFYIADNFFVTNDYIKNKSNDYLDIKEKSIFHDKIYLIVTYWSYPFGGGEEFMYDTMEWAHNLGMKCFWLSFCDAKNNEYPELKMSQQKYGKIIHIPGGFSVETLSNWVYLIRPDIVHHQGHIRGKFYMSVEKQRIEFISGFHFWGGGIILDPEKKNILMLENSEFHKTDPEFELLLGKNTANFYCASKYVQECFDKITGNHIKDIIFASSSIKRYELDNFDPWHCDNNDNNDTIDKGYVVMINIHKHKGGDIFYYLLNSCPDIKFMCVRTEHNSEELDEKIKDLIYKRNNEPDKYAKCIFMERTKDVKKIYSKTKIMLCTSLVDETFCRVVNESMMNGIPVFTTSRGNIKYLVGDTTPVLDPDLPEDWEREIKKIYYDEDAYRKMSKIMKDKYNDSSEQVAKTQFTNVMEKTIRKSKEMNVGIFSPWCDQGLGIQSRNYYNILEKSNLFKPSVFALKPYNADTCQQLQRNPDEWAVDQVYYSTNTRETVKDIELLEFCKKYNIGKMIMPETCWSRIFQIAKYLREINVKTYAVPNIEIVRKDEIFKHNYFYKILGNNFLCERIFSVLDIPVDYIGYGIEGIEFREKVFDSEIIKFLFIGGMNAFSRKHVLLICKAFAMAYEINNKISLTITIQMTNSLESKLKSEINKYLDHPAINIIQEHISYADIINFYYTSHVSMQVSKHEGLGLGFYEGLATGTPVITLNTPPHNEIILDNVNGWIVDCYYKKMSDNGDPLFGSAYFDPAKLCEKILESANKNVIEKIILNMKDDNAGRLNLSTFSKRFINALL